MNRVRHHHSGVVLLWLSLSVGFLLSVGNAAEAECQLDGSCEADLSCRLYIAEPTPGAWGIFAGKAIPSDTLLPLLDIEVPVVDRFRYKELQKLLWNVTVPESSLVFREKPQPREADMVEFASCQPSQRLEYVGCSTFDEPSRVYPNAGATTSYQSCSYRTLEPIPPGEQLLGECLAGVTNNADVKPTADWLAENGFCVDHLHVMERDVNHPRTFNTGETVAVAPVAALSRAELVMVLADVETEPHHVLWKGDQLLRNYCMGHPSSSIVFFNYLSPGVLSMYSAGDEFPANVGVRWSKKTIEDTMGYTPAELLQSNKLVMEFYALTELTNEDQLVIDYGDAVRRAWNDHAASWNPTGLVHSTDYRSARTFAADCDKELLIPHRCMNKIPSWIEVRCALDDPATLADADTRWLNRVLEGTWKNWSLATDNRGSYPCKILGLDTDEKYRVQVQSDVSRPVEEGPKVRLAPRSSIQYVDKPYTGNQLLRRAFRHEIQLPTEMIPSVWRDLEPDPDGRCELYMAESAIPFSGLGMYTAKNIRKGERIFYGEVIVNAEDVELNVRLRHWANGEVYFNEKDWLLFNYYWDSSVATALFDAMDVQTIIPGLGMLANSHTGLVNSQHRYPTKINHLNRFRDPGAGSSTTYHDMYYDATSDIEAGAELYVAYGDEWFEERTNLGVIPLSYDFELADEAIQMISKVVNGTGADDPNVEKEMIMDSLNLFRNITSSRDRLSAAFPGNVQGFERALGTGTADLTVPNRVRSIEWLEENGRCLDNIRPGKSTVKQAGHGAFATRRVKKGQVIAPMPLVHLRRRHMEVFDSADQSYSDPKAEIFRDGTQMLINYCKSRWDRGVLPLHLPSGYGHPTSSLLLFPYSPVVNYVNHNFTSPNAELRWSTLPNHHVNWLSRTPDSLDDEDHAGLIMELIATRDIQPDEEVFINYGAAWESGWNRFLNDWQTGPEGEVYASSEELNANLEWIRTQKEMYPYSNGGEIVHICFNAMQEPIEGQTGTYYWDTLPGLYDMSEHAFPCEIIGIEENQNATYVESWDRKDSSVPIEMKYTVLLELDNSERKAKVFNVPRKAIRFIDTRYNSDNYFRGGFRHAIHLPDHMVPKKWRDLTKGR